MLFPYAAEIWKAKEKEGVYVIGPLKQKLDALTWQVCGKTPDKDETLKISLRTALELDERDVVMLTATRIVIKKFVGDRVKPHPPKTPQW